MTHPGDIELAAWVDEPATADTGLAGHVAACDDCREAVAEIEATRAALALAPPMPAATELAAQRDRIAAAIGAGDRDRARVLRRLGWLAPLAAAAVVAAVVLVGRSGPDAPTTAGTGPRTRAVAAPAIPLVADALEAAELAATAIAPDPGAVVIPSEPIDGDLLDAAFAAVEPLAPPASVEASMIAESRFSELDAVAQSAVLVELASADLDL